MIINPYALAAVGGGGGGSDPNFANVSLLLHFNGTNGSTTFTDDSANVFTVTAHGAAVLSTTTPQFGTAALNVDGQAHSAADYASVPIVTAGPLDFQTGDWTVEGWLRTSVSGTGMNFMLMADPFGLTNNEGLFLSVTAGAFGKFSAQVAGASGNISLNTGSGSVAVNTWSHFALVNNGGTVELYCDGVASGGASSRPSMTSPWAGVVRVGNAQFGSAFTGDIDDVRITKGVARYTSNFSPPAVEFPNS